MSNRATRLDNEAALRLVVEGTVSETGVGFFRTLVRNLARVLGTLGAWVTEYDCQQKRMLALAMWLDGRYIDHLEYPIAGTACAKVVESKTLIHIPDRLIELFPHDGKLVPLSSVSYLGAPLLDTDGTVMGHVSVLDDKPMPRDERAVSLFEIFAARAGAEHRRLKAEQSARAREEQMSLLLESAMDAIMVLDDQMRVVRVNPAAERLFKSSVKDLLGERFNDFLDAESAARMDAFLKELDAQPAHRRQLWIPRSFTMSRGDGSCFPAEATLSRFQNRGEIFNTLILRNVDERVEAERHIASLTMQTEYLREEIRSLQHLDEIIGQSEALRQVLREVEQVAVTDTTVLIQGETGTGKELFARAIHTASTRRKEPLVTVNCAAIPANLIESEFFGHERGAFTGATNKREGRFSLADRGTIFLDEVGELPLDLQSKLLRVLQEGTFEPVGGTTTRKVNVRVIAATNRDLEREAAEGRFRQDLFYRLSVFPLTLPPLRDRLEDVPALAEAFARRFASRIGRTIQSLSAGCVRRLQNYAWPGNVRELQNVIERAVITSVNGRLNLDRALPDDAPMRASTGSAKTETASAIRTQRELEVMERENLTRALAATDWRISGERGAATLLGMNPSTLRSRIKALGVKSPK